MVEYIENIVVPYVDKVRDMLFTSSTPGLIIMDNFKGQITKKIELEKTTCTHVFYQQTPLIYSNQWIYRLINQLKAS